MRKILSLFLAVCLLFSMTTVAFADGKQTHIKYVGTGVSKYEVTVPSLMVPGETGDVILEGTWDSETRIVVEADEVVYMYNDIDKSEFTHVEIGFNGLDVLGNNRGEISEVEVISVSDIDSSIIFGTWDGYINYYVTPVDVMETLAGTTWKFNEELSDCSFLGTFDFENQNGVLYYPEGSTITSGDISYEFWSLTRDDTFGITTLSTVASSDEETFILYVYPNDLELDGWFSMSGETVYALNTGELTDIEEIVSLITHIEAPTIYFADAEAEEKDETGNTIGGGAYLLRDKDLINWLKDNATQLIVE